MFEATISGIEKGEANYEVFNVGFEQAIGVNTVASILIKQYRRNPKIIISGDYRLGNIRDNYADLTKIKSKFGFEPKVSFEEGIRRFVAWVEKQVVAEDKYEKILKR